MSSTLPTSRRRRIGACVATLVLTALTSGLAVNPAAASTSGVSLMPAAGQFVAVSGTEVYSASVTPSAGSPFLFSVSATGGATGIPADAAAVALEIRVTGSNFAGVVKTGAGSGAVDTSLAFARSAFRNGFDVTRLAGDGTIAGEVDYLDTGVASPGATVSIRVHGYFTSSGGATAGSTFVGEDVKLLADSNAGLGFMDSAGNLVTGTLNISSGTPPDASAIYHARLSNYAGIPGDGSVAAVAVQVVVKSDTCASGSQANWAIVPRGSGRTDYSGAFEHGHKEETFDVVPLSASDEVDFWIAGCTATGGGTATALASIRTVGYFVKNTWSTPGSTYVPIDANVPFQTAGAPGGAVGAANCDAGALNANGQLNPGYGCTFQVLGTGTGTSQIPFSGVTSVAAQVIALDPTADGCLGLFRPSAPNMGYPTECFTGNEGQDSNFAIDTYTTVGLPGTLYVMNMPGGHATDVMVRIRGYFKTPSAPGTPTAVSVTRQSTTATVTWTPPLGDGGAAITGYQVSTDQGSPSVTVGAAVRTATLTGLSSQGLYKFTVAAINDVGTGSPATVTAGTLLYFSSQNGGYSNDVASDPLAGAQDRAPAGSQLSALPPTSGVDVSAQYGSGLAPGSAATPTFGLQDGLIANLHSVCVDVWVKQGNLTASQVALRLSLQSANPATTVDLGTLTAGSAQGQLVHLQGVLQLPESVPVLSTSSIFLSGFVDQDVASLSYDSVTHPSRLEFNCA